LEDPHGEFFVASDPAVTDEARLWFDKYSIRKSMIPKFLPLSWVKKILATGKSINFLRCVCGDASSNITNRDKMMAMLDKQCSSVNLFEEAHGNKLLEAVQQCYTETSALVLDTLFKQ
jgi:gamma-tubulin complex component 3